MFDVQREDNPEPVTVSGSSREMLRLRDMHSSTLEVKPTGEWSSSTNSRVHIRHGNVSGEAQTCNDRKTVAASGIRSRRCRDRKLQCRTPILAFVFTIWCFLCTRASAVQCSPCPVACSCSPISGTPERCVVDCSDTELAQFPTDLPEPDSIVALHLHDNHLRNLLFTDLSAMTNLQSLSLHDNPFTCDCDMVWLPQWLSWRSREYNLSIDKPDEIKCDTPAHVKDRQLGSLSLSEFTCGDSKYISCVRSEVSLKYTMVVFTSHYSNITDESVCRKTCFDGGFAYGLVTKWLVAGSCLCGEVPTSDVPGCSCTNSNGYELPSGATTCGSMYIHGAWMVDDHSIRLNALRPFSTSDNVFLKASAKIPFDYYTWKTIEPKYEVQTKNPELVNNFYYAERYNLSVYGVSNARKSKTMEFQISVLDPVDIELTDDELYADVDKTLNITAIVRQGTDFIVTWTYTDNSSQTNPEMFCPNDWVYTGRRCIGIVSDQAVTFDEADRLCHENNAEMLRLRNRKELKGILRRVTQGSTDGEYYYLGAKREIGTSSYIWVETGRLAQFTAVNVSLSADGLCLVGSYPYVLQGTSCDAPYKFICQTDPVVCSHGNAFDDETKMCYHVGSPATAASYGMANAVCAQNSGELVAIETPEISKFLNATLALEISYSYWIGLDSLADLGTYTWLSGTFLGQFAPWKIGHEKYTKSKCVAMVIDAQRHMKWELRDCDERLPYICQYPPGESRHTVQNYVAGQPGAYGIGPSTVIKGSSLMTEQSEHTTSVILSGLGISHSGMLHTWYIDVRVHQADIRLNLMVLRPSCPDGFYLLTPGCREATLSFPVCTRRSSSRHPITRCPRGQQYCTLAQACIGVFMPCTCLKYPNASTCISYLWRDKRSIKEREKRWAIPTPWRYVNYKVVGTTALTVGGSRVGLLRVKTSPIEIHKDDVLGFQYDGSLNPVRWFSGEHTEWNVMTDEVASEAFVRAGQTLRLNFAEKHPKAYALVALYSNSMQFVPSVPCLDKSNYGVGNFTYTVYTKNPVSRRTASVLVHFQKRVSGLSLVMKSVLRSLAGRTNAYECYFESGLIHTFLVAIRQGTDVSLRVDYPDQSEELSFSSDCPSEFADRCLAGTAFRSAQFAKLSYAAEAITPEQRPIHVRFNASNRISWNLASVDVHIQKRIAGLKIDLTSSDFMAKEMAVFRMSLGSGSHVRYRWAFSDQTQAASGKITKHLFKVAGRHTVTASACNEINCVNTSVAITVWNEARVKNWLIDKYPGVYRDEDFAINVSLQASSWSQISIFAFYGDGSQDEANFKTETGSVVRYRFTHVYATADVYGLVISIVDQLTHRTVNISETVTVCKRCSHPTIIGSRYLAVSSDQRFEASIGLHRLGMQYLWDFGDGSAPVTTSEPQVYRAYNGTGHFRITVKTQSCAGALSASTTVTVQEGISGLALESDSTVLINEPLSVNVSYQTGSDVSIQLYNGSFYRNLSQAAPVENLRYTFGANGTYNISATAWNMVSESTVYRTVYVYSTSSFDVVDVLDGEAVVLGEPTEFSAVVLYQYPLSLSYAWLFGDGTTDTGRRIAYHTYTRLGVYVVTVTVSRNSEKKSFNKSIQVQERLKGLSLYTNTTLPLSKGSTAMLYATAKVGSGSDFEFIWNLNGTEFDTHGAQLTAEVRHSGKTSLKVKVQNKVSSLEKEALIDVVEEIRGITIQTNATLDRSGRPIFKLGQDYFITAAVTSGTCIKYNWRIDGISNSGQSVYHSFQSTGAVTLNVVAENILNSVQEQIEGYVLQSVTDVKLEINTSQVITYLPVRVSAITNATNLTCEFQICLRQQCEKILSVSRDITWSFQSDGLYDITAYVSNPLDSSWAYLAVEAFYDIEDVRILINGSNNTQYVSVERVTTFKADVTSKGLVELNWTIASPDGRTTLYSSEEFKAHFSVVGSYHVSLAAWNGAIRKEIKRTIRVVELIEDVSMASDAISGTYMMVGKEYSFNAKCRRGTDLKFEWTLNTPNSNIKIKHKSFVYRFTETGRVTIKLYAENVLSTAWNESLLEVESVIDNLEIRNNATNSSYVPVGIPVRYMPNENNFWPVSYTWQLTEGSVTRMYNGCCIDYTFQSLSSINISLNASNDVSYYNSDIEIMAEESIQFAKLVPEELTTYSNVNETFRAVLTSGTNVQFFWRFGNAYRIRTDLPYHSYAFPVAGSYKVTVLAANHVSRAKKVSLVTVINHIGDVYIVNCCSGVYPANTQLSFAAAVTSGSVNDFNWTWIGNGKTDRGNGDVFNTSFPAHGIYKLGVTASNQLDTDSHWENVYVEEPIETAYLRVIGDLLGLVTSELVTFRAVVPRGDPVFCSWLVNSTDICSGQNDSMTCRHRFNLPGTYVVTVIAYNNVSLANDTQIVQVHRFMCTEPSLTLVGDQYRKEKKSNPVRIDVTIDACTRYSLIHKWSIYKKRCKDLVGVGNEIQFPPDVCSNTPLLYLPARTLDYGDYCLRFESNYNNTNTQPSPYISVSLAVEKTALRAVIKGGHEVLISVEDRIIIDGSLSYDPDKHKNEPQLLTYWWSCVGTDPANAPCFNSSNTSVVVVEPNTFREGHSYNVTLRITSPDGRNAVTYQKIIGKSVHLPIVTIDCVSCRELNAFTVCSSQPVKLLGDCQNCRGAKLFSWQVEQNDGTPLVLDRSTTTTGSGNKNLVIKPGSLLLGKAYRFILNVTAADTKKTGSAILTLPPSVPPSSGKCEALHPRVVTAVEDFIYVRCTGWIDNSGSTSPLVYNVYVANHYGEWYPIYRGTQSEVLSVLSPFRDYSEDVTLIVAITDNTGMWTVGLNQTVRVVSPELDSGESCLSRITFYIEKRLPIVQRAGNPKLLLSYTITLVLELNREAARFSSDEWREDQDQRRILRRELLRVLSESLFIIPAIDDVQQTAYALKLLTKYPSDFPVSDTCYKVVLDLCEEMLNTIAPKVSQGWTGGEFVPEYLLATFSNIIQTIHAELTVAALEGNYDLDLWTRRMDIMQSVMTFSENVTFALLSTQVANEEPYWFECGTANFTGQRVLANDIRQQYNYQEYHVIFPKDIVAHLPPETEIFQTLNTSLMNPYLWGFVDGLPLNSYVVSPNFAFINGTDVPVHDLPKEREFQLSCARSPFQEPDFWENLKEQLSNLPKLDNYASLRSFQPYANDVTPLPTELNYTSTLLKPKMHLSSILPLTDKLSDEGAVGFQLMVTVYESVNAFPHANMGNASLYIGVGYMPHKYQFDQILTVRLTDLGWSDPEKAVWSSSFTWLERPTSRDQVVYLTLNNDDPELTLNMSVAMYVSICKYYDPRTFTWKTDGCHVTKNTTSTWTTCRCNHMTTFGASVYLAPNHLEFEHILKMDFNKNPVVISTVCGLAGLLTVVFLLARRWDQLDTVKVSKMPLCGKDAAYKYEVTIITGRQLGAGTTAHIGMKLYGKNGKSARYFLHCRDGFRRASVDTVIVATENSLADLTRLHIWHDNHGLDPSWYLSRVVVRDLQNNKIYHFIVESWLSLSYGDYVIEKKVNVAAPEELRGFRSVFKARLSEGFSDDHIFISVFDRPPHASFTRVQRVTCCTAFLYLYMFINAMWFAVLRTPTEREVLTGVSPLQWIDIFVGILASVIVFPVTTGVQQLFKYAKHKTTSVGVSFPRPPTAQTVEMDTMISLSSHDSGAVPSHGARRRNVATEDMNSKPVHNGRLRRTAPVMHIGQEGNLTMSDTSSVQSGVQSENNLWFNDGILVWPDELPPTRHSRQSSDSSTSTRFLYDRRTPNDKLKRKASTGTVDSEMMELEEIEDDDLWLDKDKPETSSKDNAVGGSDEVNQMETTFDEDTWNSSVSSTTQGATTDDKMSCKPAEAFQKKSKVTKRPFSPRTDADIDNLIEELDAVINGETNSKHQWRCGTTDASGHSRSEGTTIPATRSRKMSECSLQDVRPSILIRRDSLALARRGSVSFGERTPAQPLKPSAELASISAAGDPNLWAWSRSSTWYDVPQYIPIGPPTDTRRCELPHWCVHLAYSICVLLTAVSILMVLTYGQAFGMDLSLRWLLACFFTVVLSVFIMEPVKVVVIALIVALTSGTLETSVHRLGVQPVLEVNEKIKDNVKVKPISGFALLQAREDGRKVNRMHSMLQSFFLYFGLIVTVMTICYMYHNVDTYRMVEFTNRVLFEGRTINETVFGQYLDTNDTAISFFEIIRCEDMWRFLERSAAPWLHQYELFPLDTSLVLLGVGRLRQIRSYERNCSARSYLQSMNVSYLVTSGCFGEPDKAEDTSDYGVGWNRSTTGNYSWWYTHSDRNSLRYHGNVSVYSGGGYIQNLGQTMPETISILNTLQLDNWIDRGTRAVILEFTLYNVNVDLYLVNRLGFEFPLSGGIVTSRQLFSSRIMRYESNRVDPVMVTQFFLLALDIWLAVHVLQQICRECKQYMTTSWNWLELCLLVGITSSLGLYVAVVVINTRNFTSYFDNRDEFMDFARDAYLCFVWQCINAFNLFMLMMMIVHQLRYIKPLSVFLETLHKIKWKILNMFMIFIIGLCTYSFTGYLWYGHLVYPFHSIGISIGTMVTLFRGSGYFFDDMLIVDTHFTTFFILTFCWLMFVFVFGLILAIITDAYHDVRSHKGYRDSLEIKDYEMVDFMLERFKVMIKIKKPKPAFRRVKFQGLPTLSSATSRTTHSSLRTHSQTTSSLASDPFDIDWDEVTHEDIHAVAEHVENRWDTLLDKLEELEASEQEEDRLYKRIFKMLGYGLPRTKGKLPVSGKVRAKGNSSNFRNVEKRSPVNAKLIAEKLLLEDVANQNVNTTSCQKPPDLVTLSNKSNVNSRPRRPAMSRSLSTTVMTSEKQAEQKTVRTISSASQSCLVQQKDDSRLEQSPMPEKSLDAWTE